MAKRKDLDRALDGIKSAVADAKSQLEEVEKLLETLEGEVDSRWKS